MAGVKSLIGLALTGSTGMTLLILACTLQHQNWWPAIMLLNYLAAPFPLLVSKQFQSELGMISNPAKEWAYFVTTGIVVSAFALPIVMARCSTIGIGATFLSLTSSLFFFATIVAFFVVFKSDDSEAASFY